ncbi:hypothetical protein BGX24_003155 [Mortierella sp. AD032]|nr:hypothetical protein BGX24_003155 [Mortierella sp. AD032]
MMHERLAALEASSRRLAAVDFSAPRLYSSLLLENQAVPIRNAKSFEQNLFSSNRIETLRNMMTREGADEFETTLELATALNEICQNRTVQARLDEVADAHVDVLSSISQLSATLAELQEANASEDIQEPPRQEGDEILTDIMREEGEIFALEQLLSEKRQLLGSMQRELDGLTDVPGEEFMDQDRDDNAEVNDEDMEVEAEAASKKLEIEYLENEIQEQKQREQEQIALYERLMRESDELSSSQQGAAGNSEEEISSPVFEEIAHLWEKANQQNGDAKVDVEGLKEAYHRLVRLLDGVARCQRHIVNMDILQQISSNIIDGCCDPSTAEFDPPSTISVILAARTLQMIRESGGSIPLQDLKDHISKEAVERGSAETLGVQAVYSLVASHLIQIDRSQKSNMVSLS